MEGERPLGQFGYDTIMVYRTGVAAGMEGARPLRQLGYIRILWYAAQFKGRTLSAAGMVGKRTP